jgi:hypothetical protein
MRSGKLELSEVELVVFDVGLLVDRAKRTECSGRENRHLYTHETLSEDEHFSMLITPPCGHQPPLCLSVPCCVLSFCAFLSSQQSSIAFPSFSVLPPSSMPPIIGCQTHLRLIHVSDVGSQLRSTSTRLSGEHRQSLVEAAYSVIVSVSCIEPSTYDPPSV